MHTFVQIAEQGSLTRAADAMGTSLPAVVRSLAALEAHLGARLFQRTTRRIALTDEGRRYLASAREVLLAADAADRALTDEARELAGHLTVTAPVLFGHMHVAPAIVRFMQQHPQIRCTVLLHDRTVNLLEEGIDVGIRISPLDDSSLVAQALGTIRPMVVASPAWLHARGGAPTHPRELAHETVVHGRVDGASHWTFHERGKAFNVPVTHRLAFNHLAPAIEACAAGMGLGMFLSYQVQGHVADGRLQTLLEDFAPPPAPGERDLPARAAAAGAHAGLRRLDAARIRRPAAVSRRPTGPPLALCHNRRVQAPLFQARHLRKRYGDHTVVDDLSFEIAAGECLGVIGPNGAGKTTTIRMGLGLTAPDEGEIEALGGLRMPRDARAIKARLGVVSQFDSLDPDFTCAENLVVYARYFGLGGRAFAERVPRLLEFAALSHKADAKPGELSGGMRRRLSLARALVNDPDLLILDEPTTGLDPQARHLMWERLQTLLQQGKSILLTTHFMDEAERLCSRLLVIDHGRKIAEGKPRELIAQHLEPDVVEVYGTGALALADDAALRGLAARVEVSGETVFFYTQDARRLLDALMASHGGLRTFHRPANLEDLFLKLTGRQIREDG